MNASQQHRRLRIVMEIKRRIEVAEFQKRNAERLTFAYAAPRLRERSSQAIEVYTKRLEAIRRTSEINFLITK